MYSVVLLFTTSNLRSLLYLTDIDLNALRLNELLKLRFSRYLKWTIYVRWVWNFLLRSNTFKFDAFGHFWKLMTFFLLFTFLKPFPVISKFLLCRDLWLCTCMTKINALNSFFNSDWSPWRWRHPCVSIFQVFWRIIFYI